MPIPNWRQNLPLLVLSILMLVLGGIMGLALLNLPLPHTDPIVGDVRIVIYAFVAMGLGFGGAFARIALTNRVDAIFWLFAFPGTIGFLLAMTTSIIFHPSFQAL